MLLVYEVLLLLAINNLDKTSYNFKSGWKNVIYHFENFYIDSSTAPHK